MARFKKYDILAVCVRKAGNRPGTRIFGVPYPEIDQFLGGGQKVAHPLVLNYIHRYEKDKLLARVGQRPSLHIRIHRQARNVIAQIVKQKRLNELDPSTPIFRWAQETFLTPEELAAERLAEIEKKQKKRAISEALEAAAIAPAEVTELPVEEEPLPPIAEIEEKAVISGVEEPQIVPAPEVEAGEELPSQKYEVTLNVEFSENFVKFAASLLVALGTFLTKVVEFED